MAGGREVWTQGQGTPGLEDLEETHRVPGWGTSGTLSPCHLLPQRYTGSEGRSKAASQALCGAGGQGRWSGLRWQRDLRLFWGLGLGSGRSREAPWCPQGGMELSPPTAPGQGLLCSWTRHSSHRADPCTPTHVHRRVHTHRPSVTLTHMCCHRRPSRGHSFSFTPIAHSHMVCTQDTRTGIHSLTQKADRRPWDSP